MTIIVEDGSIVANANSLATDAQLVAYAAARNVTIADTSAGREVLLIKAMDYIKSKERQLQGSRVSAAQTLPMPRTGMTIHGFSVASNTIPQQMVDAQCELAMRAHSFELLTNKRNTGTVISETIDVISTTYANDWRGDFVELESVDAILEPMLKSAVVGGALSARFSL